MAEQLRFCLKNSISELDKLKTYVERFCVQLGCCAKNIFHIKFSLEEIFVNIVSYGFKDDEEHLIWVTLQHDEGLMIMRIVDDGIPFNPLESASPKVDIPIEDRQVGGLGLHLTKFVCQMSYDRVNNHNVLTITKSIPETMAKCPACGM